MYILFFCKYPDSATAKDGMPQRIIAVDKQLSDKPRIYIRVSYRHNTTLRKEELECGAIQYTCNVMLHMFFINKMIKNAYAVYFHSLLNVLPVAPFLGILRKHKNLVLDLHGVVPEEQLMIGGKLKANTYQLAERILFDRVRVVIAVTNQMAAFYRKKYPNTKAKFVVYPILPPAVVNSISGQKPFDEEESGRVRIVYSGNTQKWQNVEEMLELIKRNYSESYDYTILTGELTSMKKLISNEQLLGLPNIHVLSVNASELSSYYANAHYGFILRDDILVNNVACPTKLVEYLFYGMVPIVKSESVGDFHELGYEYIKMTEFNNKLLPKKSKKNYEIIKKLIIHYSNISLRDEIAI